MTLLNQSFSVCVSGREDSFILRTCQKVIKRVADILYLHKPTGDSVKLAYVGSDEANPKRNLFIGDRSDSLYVNSRLAISDEFHGQGIIFNVSSKNFYVTQVFNEIGSLSVPLYFKHPISQFIIPESLKIFDQDFNIIGSDRYLLERVYDYDDDTAQPGNFLRYDLYNNFENSFDILSGDYQVYFVQYTKHISGEDVVVTELINNEPIYTQAVYEDIWFMTGGLKPWSKKYNLSTDTNSLTVTLPRAGKFSVKYIDKKRFTVVEPTAIDDTAPWYLRIPDGSISYGFAARSYLYSVPEFAMQRFNPYEPYRICGYQKCFKISDNLVKLPQENLETGSVFVPISVEFKLNGIVVYALTTDLSKIGTNYQDIDGNLVYNSNHDPIQWRQDLLLGYDRYAGIIHLGFNVLDSYDIYATFTYKEDYMLLTSLNMNPTFDSSVAKEVRVIYVVPQAEANHNVGIQTQSICWLKVASDGKISDCNQTSGTGNIGIRQEAAIPPSGHPEFPARSLSGVLGIHYSLRAVSTTPADSIYGPYNRYIEVGSASHWPSSGWLRVIDNTDKWRYVKFIGKTDTSLYIDLSTEEFTIGGEDAPVELVNFLDEYTTMTTRVLADELEHSTRNPDLGTFPPIFQRYFVLADASINPPHSHNDLVFIDVRENGGGVIPEKYEEAKQKNPQIQWFLDFAGYDGQPYPGNSVIVVKLPESIKETFTESQIADIVGQSVPLGVKPIIRYYGYQPDIISVVAEI